MKGKLVSIDVETTGLDPKVHDILEVAAIVFDINPNIKEISSFHCFINNKVTCWDQDTFNFHMINEYFEYMNSFKGVLRLNPSDFELQFRSFLRESLFKNEETTTSREEIINSNRFSITAVGKNFGSFDAQFLYKLCPSFKTSRLFRHRSIDLGNLLWDPKLDGVILPDSNECLKRSKIEDNLNEGVVVPNFFKHRAMDDAEQVMLMCRKYVSLKL